MEDLAAMKTDLDKLLTLAAFVTDAKACAKRVEELRALTAQAIESQAAAEAAQAELAQLKAKHEAAFEERAAELFQRHQATEELEQSIDLNKQTVLRVLSEIRTIDDQMKINILNYAGLLDGFDLKRRDLPSWESLNRDTLGKYDRDPHFGKQKSENGRDDIEEYATETGPVPDAMPDATITRSHRMMSRVS